MVTIVRNSDSPSPNFLNPDLTFPSWEVGIYLLAGEWMSFKVAKEWPTVTWNLYGNNIQVSFQDAGGADETSNVEEKVANWLEARWETSN